MVSEQQASRVTDIRSFAAEVMRELAVRPLLDDPLDAVCWLGDITAVVRGDDASAKRRLACRLISLGLPSIEGTVPDELVEEIAGAGALAVSEMNAVIDRLDGALVSFDEEPVTPEDLADIGDAVRAALAQGDARRIQTFSAPSPVRCWPTHALTTR